MRAFIWRFIDLMAGLVRGPTLAGHFRPKRVTVCGMFFTIRRIDPLDHLTGAKVMLPAYDLYKSGGAPDPDITEAIQKRIRAHQIDVFMAGVVEPQLKRKPEGEGILVDHLFTDPALSNGLYEAIVSHTYGKKNFSRLISRAKTS